MSRFDQSNFSSSSRARPKESSTSTHYQTRSAHYGNNLLLDLPIAWRLTLGFLVGAFIAATVTGIIGFQRTATLSQQSDFYQSLLTTNTNLTTGASLLQLMTTKTNEVLDVAAGPSPSQETLATGQDAILRLVNRYDTLLTSYTTHDLLLQNPPQMALLSEGGHTIQGTQQRSLADSALRTWKVYSQLEEQVLQDITTGNVPAAQYVNRFQAEPTNADALSASGSLIQFNERLANSIRDATVVVEQNQLITTIIGAIIAFIGIVLVGWFISNTLVRRLNQLLQVIQAVEQGQFTSRVSVVGRDEIAKVSASTNGMLDAIGSLLNETRSQRDALTNAAEHLFSDIRVVSSGDLRVSAPVSDDPIGLLANAFNFTVGRFRRFVLRTQTMVEQIEVISRQEIEHSESFSKNIHGTTKNSDKNSDYASVSQRLSSFETKRSTQDLQKDKTPDATQLSESFAQEMIAMARQLASITQELRAHIISF